MSDLSEAIARAEARLAGKSDEYRFKYHVIILQEELRRGQAIAMEARQGGDAKQAPSSDDSAGRRHRPKAVAQRRSHDD